MMDIIASNAKQIRLQKLDFTIKSSNNTFFYGWVGSILRNNLLYAAQQIIVDKQHTLLDKIDSFPLPKEHPCFHALKNGFPKGYVILLNSHCNVSNYTNSTIKICMGEEISFSVVLIGSVGKFDSFFVAAIMSMCQRGLGFPLVQFTVTGFNNAILSPTENLPDEEIKYSKIEFVTPVQLYKATAKKETKLSYQEKMNGFPSFYQLVRSSLSRIMLLSILYENGVSITEEDMEDYLADAAKAVLLEARLYKEKISGSKRDDKRARMLHTGYVGEMVYSGNLCKYLPVLSLAQSISVGDDIVYGFGQIKISL